MGTMSAESIALIERGFSIGFADTPAELGEAQRLRYLVYLQEHGYEPGLGGIDADEHDSHARHVVLRLASGEMVGTARLVTALPGQPRNSFPMQSVCDASVFDGLPVARTGEISRFLLSRDLRRLGGRADAMLRLGLMKGLLQASHEIGLTHWCAVMEHSLLRLLRQASIHFEAVGPAIECHGVRQPARGSIEAILERGNYERPAIWDYVTDGGRYYASTRRAPAAIAA
jgi:N-acyl-L-homoserine lactone synthetase